MKKLLLIGVTVGLASLAQAGSITILDTTKTGSISGSAAYIYLEQIAKGTQITGASISFNLTLTASGTVPNVLFYDLINAPSTTGAYVTQNLNGTGTGESTSDYFQGYLPYKGISDQLSPSAGMPFTLNVPNSWTYTFSGTALQDLENDVSNRGYFGIGLDPNCTFKGSVVLTYGVPDQAMTASLLGMSFLGLLVFRRKVDSK